MDEKDREIIQLLQNGFPLEPEPFAWIGDKLWIDEVAVISRLARLSQEGTIRYLGTFFDSRKLGYQGTLAAMDVAPGQVELVADVMNGIPQVTHNYLRDGQPNIWFTVLARDEAEMKGIMEQIRTRTGVSDIKLFPSRRHFKIRTDMA